MSGAQQDSPSTPGVSELGDEHSSAVRAGAHLGHITLSVPGCPTWEMEITLAPTSQSKCKSRIHVCAVLRKTHVT